MHGHLVAVEVGVERRTDQRMQLDGLAFDQHRLERLDAEAVQRRRAVQQHRMLRMTSSRMSHTTGVPDSTSFFAALMVVAMPIASRREDEGLEQLQRHLLRQAALVQLERRADHDDRTARSSRRALAEQVLAEAALLALDHVGQRLERALVGAGHRLAAAAVVEQRVDGLLQHALSLRTMMSGAFSSSRRAGGCCG